MRARYHRQAREAELLAEVKRALAILTKLPLSSPLWPDVPTRLQVRRSVLRKFPFSIAYLVHQDILVILAVAHESREPGYGWGRLDELE